MLDHHDPKVQATCFTTLRVEKYGTTGDKRQLVREVPLAVTESITGESAANLCQPLNRQGER